MKPFGVFEDEEELNHRWDIANNVIYYISIAITLTVVILITCLSLHELQLHLQGMGRSVVSLLDYTFLNHVQALCTTI